MITVGSLIYCDYYFNNRVKNVNKKNVLVLRLLRHLLSRFLLVTKKISGKFNSYENSNFSREIFHVSNSKMKISKITSGKK